MSPTDNVYGGDTFEEGTEILAARIYTRPTLDILKTRMRALPLYERAFVCLFVLAARISVPSSKVKPPHR